MLKKISLMALLLILVTGLVVPMASAQDSGQTPQAICDGVRPTEPETREFEQAEQVLEPGVDYYAIFCTSAGAIYVDLYEQFAPITVNNFVFLAQNGYYTNTNFHRVIADFMVQGGDPTNTGTGGPGYEFEDEFVGFLTFSEPGLLAMANAGPGTNGSQFFITTVPTPHLDFRHTIFGKVISGQENVEAIELRDPATAAADQPGTSLQAVLIIDAPENIDVALPEAATAPTQEEVVAAFAGVGEQLPPFLALENPEPTPLTTEDAVAAAPEAVQEDYAAFLSSHNHEYQISDTIVNTECDMASFPIGSMTYTIDAFATAEDAAAALEEGFYTQLWTEQGLTETDTEALSNAFLRGTATACEMGMTQAVTFWQRGRFIVTAGVVYQESDDLIPTEEILSNLVGLQVFEPLLADVLRREVSAR